MTWGQHEAQRRPWWDEQENANEIFLWLTLVGIIAISGLLLFF